MDAFHLAILVCAVPAGDRRPGVLVRAAGQPVARADGVLLPGHRERSRARRPSAADPERPAVAGDDDVGGREDPRAPALDGGLVGAQRVDLGRPVRVPPQWVRA